MRKCCAVLLASWMIVAARADAGDHVVTPRRVQATLAAAAAARDRDVARLERTLSTPAAERVAAQAGVDVARVRQALPALTDAEARDLAARAEALDTDPAAGILGTLTDLVVLVLLVLLVVLLARELN